MLNDHLTLEREPASGIIRSFHALVAYSCFVFFACDVLAWLTFWEGLLLIHAVVAAEFSDFSLSSRVCFRRDFQDGCGIQESSSPDITRRHLCSPMFGRRPHVCECQRTTKSSFNHGEVHRMAFCCWKLGFLGAQSTLAARIINLLQMVDPSILNVHFEIVIRNRSIV